MNPGIYLKKGREASLGRFHPWVFSGAVARIEGNPSEGSVVTVYSSQGEVLACGHFQIGSIAVRILSFGTETLPEGFWENSVRNAVRMRMRLGLMGAEGTDCCRLIHGEGDMLPGLVVDWYGGVCVMQAHSAGMFMAKDEIAKALKTVLGDRLAAIYDKSSQTAPHKAGLALEDGYVYEAPGFVRGCRTVVENGNPFAVDWEGGQKTGFFLDQRDNRALAGRLSAGRNVLNLFCYTGGFSVYALRGGARHVTSVDSSAKAVEMLRKNVELSGFGDDVHEAVCGDAIDYLKSVRTGEYDLMIVDPPAFAKHRGAIDNAVRAYTRLNEAAISKVASGGFILTFSCSQTVDKETFALAVFTAAAHTGRRVRILGRLTQPADHAVNIYHPEGEYLKGMLLYIE